MTSSGMQVHQLRSQGGKTFLGKRWGRPRRAETGPSSRARDLRRAQRGRLARTVRMPSSRLILQRVGWVWLPGSRLHPVVDVPHLLGVRTDDLVRDAGPGRRGATCLLGSEEDGAQGRFAGPHQARGSATRKEV